MTSKTRKRTQAGRRDHDNNTALAETRKDTGELTPIAPNQTKPKSGNSPKASPNLTCIPVDSDSDDEGNMKAHLGKNKRPDLIGTRPCERFLAGHCNFGKDCWFVHDVEAREQARASGSSLASSASSQLKLEDDPPKPKISLAPTNPWGKPLPEDEDDSGDGTSLSGHSESGALSVTSDVLQHMGMDDGMSDRIAALTLPAAARGRNGRNNARSALLPATPSTQPALGVFSVVDMLVNVRSGLFEDARSRGVALNPSPSHTGGLDFQSSEV